LSICGAESHPRDLVKPFKAAHPKNVAGGGVVI